MPPVVRTPNGVVQDTREYSLAGRALSEPSGIKAPTLIVVGEWDAGTPVAGAEAVFGKLSNAPYKRLVQIGEGTHVIFLEKNRMSTDAAIQRCPAQPDMLARNSDLCWLATSS